MQKIHQLHVTGSTLPSLPVYKIQKQFYLKKLNEDLIDTKDLK